MSCACIFWEEQKDRRIPVLTADVAVWDAERNGWVLYTDPVVQELKKMEQTAFGAKPKDKDKDKDPKKTKPAAEKSKDLQLGGLRSEADGNVDVAAAANGISRHCPILPCAKRASISGRGRSIRSISTATVSAQK